jgi:hypothetical protein
LPWRRDGFRLEIQKGTKEDECEKGHEEEAFDGSGVMLQDMIGVLMGDNKKVRPATNKIPDRKKSLTSDRSSHNSLSPSPRTSSSTGKNSVG